MLVEGPPLLSLPFVRQALPYLGDGLSSYCPTCIWHGSDRRAMLPLRTQTVRKAIDMTPDNQAQAIQNETVILEVIFHKPGMTRQGDLGKVETPADKKRLGLSKKIIDSPEYRAVLHVAIGCREYLRSLELEAPFKTGRHLMPLKLLEKAYARVEDAEEAYGEAADTFVAVYPEQVEAAEQSLADQFDANDYPDADDLRQQFWVERRVTSWDTPGEAKIGEYLYEKEKNRVAAELSSVAEDAKFALREGLRELTTKLAESLGEQPNGKRKRLAGSTVTKITNWLTSFNARNVLGDSELAAVAADLRSVMNGKGLTELRTNDGMRAAAKADLEKAGKSLDALMVDAPTRAINLGDD